MTMNEATLQYVRQHADDDVRMLALRGTRNPEVDLTAALQQIAGRQTARRKLPTWAQLDGIVYPPHLNLEQCSSEQTARYKAELCRRLLKEERQGMPTPEEETSLTDLTGGFGVDFSWMCRSFGKATYVERDSQLCAISSKNFEVLGLNAETRNGDAAEILSQMQHATMIFLDPARRDDHGGRTYGIADCTPNVLELKDELLRKADWLVLKLSPMLDWRKAVNDLGAQWVKEVHIVSVQNECKELLVVLTSRLSAQPPVARKARTLDSLHLFCVNDDHVFELSPLTSTSGSSQGENSHLSPLTSQFSPLTSQFSPLTSQFLYEPNASIMKAGCFDELAAAYGVSQIAPNSHIFTSGSLVDDFPGRRFRIQTVSSMNKKELKEKIGPLKQANITVRNFPLSVAELRKRLKTGEGGVHYIFATTLDNGEHVLVVCQQL